MRRKGCWRQGGGWTNGRNRRPRCRDRCKWMRRLLSRFPLLYGLFLTHNEDIKKKAWRGD
jgi:hypothetical protein